MVALGLLVVRVVTGLIVSAHGAQKVFGWWGGPGMKNWIAGMSRMRIRPPMAWAWISALAELIGGILFALGLLSPLGALAIIASMLVAFWLVHRPKGFWNSKGGFEFNLSLVGAAAGLAITGPGAYSLDSLFRLRIPEPITLIVGTVLMLAGVAVALGTRGPAPAPENKTQPA
jgi:putative oxidoreductase